VPSIVAAQVPEVVHFTPTGRRIDQALVQQMAAGPGAVLLCGRYEGIDQRCHRPPCHAGAEPGRLRAVGRRTAGAGAAGRRGAAAGRCAERTSHEQDSFSDGLLEGPHYSRPEKLALPDGELAVPPVLLSGHHADIARWRRERRWN
jgi:tRNA (guanine37-N1)-methyltransferase